MLAESGEEDWILRQKVSRRCYNEIEHQDKLDDLVWRHVTCG
jgi:hypothetical protein